MGNQMVSLTMGKLIAESRGEVALSADILEYYAQHPEVSGLGIQKFVNKKLICVVPIDAPAQGAVHPYGDLGGTGSGHVLCAIANRTTVEFNSDRNRREAAMNDTVLLDEGGSIYLVGGGIASLAAPDFLIRSGDIPGHKITIVEI